MMIETEEIIAAYEVATGNKVGPNDCQSDAIAWCRLVESYWIATPLDLSVVEYLWAHARAHMRKNIYIINGGKS